ncbi:MAG: hypothetical protein WBG95_03525 [Sulfitobacter sp.]
MMNNNKILTVSYGTFSCTLEGFDDSFGTMKAIAEYFRDLASDDRYFGAEPPQPDAQMLARIAQREASRHVEARSDEGRIVLTASENTQATALVATENVEKGAQTDVAGEEVAPQVQSDEEVPKAEIKPAAAPAVAEAQAAPAEKPDVDIVPSLPDADVKAFFADSESESTANSFEYEDEGAAPAEEKAKADSIADKLKRIRAVVSQQANAPDYSEDQHADAAIEQPTKAVAPETAEHEEEDALEMSAEEKRAVVAETLRDLEDALDADDALEAVVVADDEDEDEDIAALLIRLESDDQDRSDEASDTQASDLDMDADDMGSNILAAMDGTDGADADHENLFEADEITASDDDVDDDEEVTAPEAPRTRVLKVKRAALEAAIENGQLEEYEEDTTDGDAAPLRKAPLADASSLSEEAEDELARELAELEADMEAPEGDEPTADAVEPMAIELPDFEPVEDAVATQEDDTAEEDDAKFEEPAEHAEMHSTADDDLARLMAETDQQMDEPEGATRRDAFTHLRAAVAAKKADDAAGDAVDEKDSDEAYRGDLADVVRPRRPASGERARTERPPEARPAPLKLVAEQRIDTDKPRDMTPVRPRRVAAAAPQAVHSNDEDATSFADFASEMGAEKLPDLLEAAAAYLSFVEGYEAFSRPELMSKVRQVETDNFTREDSLRSFGKLLREGKIEKIKGGRFQASEQIGFRPDARAAG